MSIAKKPRAPFTEDEIKEMRADFHNVLEVIDCIKHKYMVMNETLSLFAWADGSVAIGGDALMGWTIIIDEDGSTRLRYSYESTVEEGDKK